ncbi:MAG TPA: hypothetical protein VJ508_18095, partial [Saprospiraceae bacterium]|nr:hypothetical protein [Saprospiraceae bacterium]
MRIKTKLILGVGLLFFFITVLIVVGIVYINQLTKDTQNILVANYNTIDYARQMMIALDADLTSGSTLAKFQENL